MFEIGEEERHFDTYDYHIDVIQQTPYTVWISEAEDLDTVRMRGTVIDIRPDPTDRCNLPVGPFCPSFSSWQFFAQGEINQTEFDRIYIEQLRYSYRQCLPYWRFLLFQPALQINSPRPNPRVNYTPAMTLAESWLRVHHRAERKATYQGTLR